MSLGDRPSGRVSLELSSPEALARGWPADEAQPIVDRRFRDGRLMMMVEQHDELGFLVSAPRHGRHLVSGDGRRIRSVLPRVSRWRWQRLLFAQVLPLAALLQGLELLHASAVALGDRALAFVARSGVGKTSVAAHLVADGAFLLTDDVMALERTSSESVRAHPGAAMASIARAEWRGLTAEGRARLGRVVGESDKLHVAVELVDRPLTLGGIYFLRRGGRVDELEVQECSPPDPTLLLSSSFVSYLSTPQRLANQLDVCARLAESVRMFHVLVPASAEAREVARSIDAHAKVAL